MQSFCFVILHIPGRVNRVADVLSRSGAQLAFLNISFALSGMAELSEDFWRGTGSAAEVKLVPTSSVCALPASESNLSEVISEKRSGLAKSEISVIFGTIFQKSEKKKSPSSPSIRPVFPESPRYVLSSAQGLEHSPLFVFEHGPGKNRHMPIFAQNPKKTVLKVVPSSQFQS